MKIREFSNTSYRKVKRGDDAELAECLARMIIRLLEKKAREKDETLTTRNPPQVDAWHPYLIYGGGDGVLVHTGLRTAHTILPMRHVCLLSEARVLCSSLAGLWNVPKNDGPDLPPWYFAFQGHSIELSCIRIDKLCDLAADLIIHAGMETFEEETAL